MRKRRAGIRASREREQSRANEEEGSDEGGDRVAGEAEDERAVPAPEGKGLAGSHRDAPEHLLDAEPLLHAPHEIVRPDRDATRRHDDVGGERLPRAAPCASSVSSAAASRVTRAPLASSSAASMIPFDS